MTLNIFRLKATIRIPSERNVGEQWEKSVLVRDHVLARATDSMRDENEGT